VSNVKFPAQTTPFARSFLAILVTENRLWKLPIAMTFFRARHDSLSSHHRRYSAGEAPLYFNAIERDYIIPPRLPLLLGIRMQPLIDLLYFLLLDYRITFVTLSY